METIFIIGLAHVLVLILQVVAGIMKFQSEPTFTLNAEKTTHNAVAVLIPVCDEDPQVLRRTLVSCKLLRGNHEVIVIENSRADKNKRNAMSVCRQLGVRCFDIENLGNKGRALNRFLSSADNDFDYFAVLDVDQQPDPGFIEELMAVLITSNDIAMVQSPQTFRNSQHNILTFLYSSMQHVFFKGISLLRSQIGYTSCYGTNFVADSKALRDVGYFDEECLTEDTATAIKLRLGGYKIVYFPESLASGLAPHNLGSLLTQIRRYAIGNRQVSLKIMFGVLGGNYRCKDWPNLAFFLHYCLSPLIASCMVFVSFCAPMFLSRNLLIANYGLLALFFILMASKVSPVRLICGSIFYFFLSPLYLLNYINVFTGDEVFQVTDKKEAF